MGGEPKLSRAHRLDSITLDSTYFTEEGYLIDHPVVTSVGIFEYRNPDGSQRRELRLPEHVFDGKSLATYEGKPVIMTHDAGRVNKNNVDSEIVGTMLTKGYQDKDDVRVKIIIHSIDAVKESGLRELSLGYDLVLDETPGEWNGQQYDAVQTEIAINHLALVREARAGDQARLNIDGETPQETKGALSMSGKAKNVKPASDELKKAIADYGARRKRRLDEAEPEEKNADSLPPDEEGAGEGAMSPPPAEGMGAAERVQLVKDRRDRRDQEGDPDTPESAMGVIAQQDEDIGTLLEIIEELQAKQDFGEAAADSTLSEPPQDDCDLGDIGGGGGEGVTLTIKTDSVDAIVRERIKLGRIGDRLDLDGLEDMKPIDAKKAIIKKVNPGMRLDGKSAAYVNAAFDVAVDQMNAAKDTNYQRKQMSARSDGKDKAHVGQTGAELARQRMIDRQFDGGDE